MEKDELSGYVNDNFFATEIENNTIKHIINT